MRRGPLIILGLCAVGAAGGGVGWYALRSRDAMAQARTLMQAGDYRSAQLVLRDLVRRQPDRAEAHLRLSQVQMRMGDPIAAEHEAHEAVSAGADEHAARPVLAQALAAQGKADAVLRDYTADGLDATQGADLHLARAVAAIMLKQFDLARAEALAADQAVPASPEPAMTLARVEQAAADLPAASRAVDHALAIEPHFYPGLSFRARLLAQQGRTAEAITAYDAVLSDPSGKQANLTTDRLAQADLYASSGNDAAARQDVDTALKATPLSPLGNYLLALIDARAGQWREADEALAVVGTSLPLFPRGDILLATVKAYVGQPQQALDAAEHFHARHATDMAGTRLLAEIDIFLGRAPAAIGLLTPWASANPPDPAVLTTLSQAYAAAGQPANAQAALQKAAAVDQSPTALSRIAAIAMREGNPGLGSDLLQAVLTAGAPPTNAAGTAQAAPAPGPAPALVNVPGTTQGTVPGATPGVTPGPPRADTAASLVIAALRARQVDRAATALDSLRAAHGDPDQLDLLTGAVRLAQFDLQGARTALDSAHARNPSAALATADLAHVMILQGDQDAAATMVRQALAKQPADPRLVAVAMEIATARGAPVDAIAAAEAAHAAAPAETGFTALLTGLYIQAKQADKALTLTDLLPADSTIQLSLRADAQRALGRGSDALASWQALLAKSPDDTALRRRIIGFLRADGRESDASAMLQKGLDSHPDDAGLQAESVALAERTGGIQAGVARADEFAARSSQLPALLLKGDLLMANRKFAEAATAYAQARTAAKPEDADTLVARQAAALAAAGDGAGSSQLLQTWQHGHAGFIAGTEMLAEADIAAGRLPDARSKLEAVLSRRPDDPAALNNLAWVEQQNGDFARSRTLASRAYGVAPSPQVADTLGWALFKTGSASDSVGLLRFAATGQPGDPAVQYHYASALKQAGKADAARAVLKPVLDRAGPFQDRADAEALLQSLGGP